MKTRYITNEQAHERLMSQVRRAQRVLKAKRLAEEKKSGESQDRIHQATVA